jgi:hypothetical protein
LGGSKHFSAGFLPVRATFFTFLANAMVDRKRKACCKGV